MSEVDLSSSGAGRRRVLLQRVAESLRTLHLRLLDEARHDYERSSGGPLAPAELLNLLMTHEHFQWLRPLSRAMAELDEILDLPDPTPAHVRAVRARFEALVTDEAEVPFGPRYREMLQRSVAVVAAHADVRMSLRPL